MRWPVRGRGRTHRRVAGQMNKTEEQYSQYLELRKRAGEIAEYWFEGVTLKLAKDLRYTPDFVVMLPDGHIELHEIKGYWEDDARVKIKTAAHLFPFRFVAIKAQAKKNGGGWEMEEF